MIKKIQLTTDENIFLGRPRSHSDHTFVGHTLWGQEVCVVQVEKYKNVASLATKHKHWKKETKQWMTASDVRDLRIPSRASVAIEQRRSQGLSCESLE